MFIASLRMSGKSGENHASFIKLLFFNFIAAFFGGGAGTFVRYENIRMRETKPYSVDSYDYSRPRQYIPLVDRIKKNPPERRSYKVTRVLVASGSYATLLLLVRFYRDV
mmetsp:Transcript_17156/g.38636  ORF Transcript_17156/g.38636 Transcript_17156/m.38636 type:complete len:109 (-) Transcript_17156:2847-3173(-)